MRRSTQKLGVILAALLFIVGCGASSSSTPPQLRDPLADAEARDLVRRGHNAVEDADYLRAEQYFVAAVEAGFPIEEVIQPLVAACVRGSRLSAALNHAEPYLRTHPDEWALRQLVATIHMGLGQPIRARLELETVIATVPTEAMPHYMLGVLARDNLHDRALAEQEFNRYLELAPEGEHAQEVRVHLELERAQVRTSGPVRIEEPSASSSSESATP